jgi:hypothetical protein
VSPQQPQTQQDQSLFLYIPTARLIFLSIASMGFYEAYWIYKNWKYIKDRDGLKISPFWRGLFGVFFCHSLLKRIYEDKEAQSIHPPSFSPNGLATCWVILVVMACIFGGNHGIFILSITGWSPSITTSIISAAVPSLCFVPVQNYINAMTKERNLEQSNYRWSSGHNVCLAIGVLMWILILSRSISEALS